MFAKEPSVKVIDEVTGQTFSDSATQSSRKLSSRMKEFIAELEEEFSIQGYKVVLARMPADKTREVDLEIQDVPGVIKTTIDRGAAVSAEDGARMIRYLQGQGITEYQYIDVRVARKGYWR